MREGAQARLDAEAAEFAAPVGTSLSGIKHGILMRAIFNAHGQPFGGGECLTPA